MAMICYILIRTIDLFIKIYQSWQREENTMSLLEQFWQISIFHENPASKIKILSHISAVMNPFSTREGGNQ